MTGGGASRLRIAEVGASGLQRGRRRGLWPSG